MQKRQQNDITMQKNETQMTNNMAEKMIRVPSKSWLFLDFPGRLRI